MIRLEKYIAKESGAENIVSVPTYSSHATLAKRYINDILTDHSEYQHLINAIVSYPVQKWADLCREKINIDAASIGSALETESDEVFGIKDGSYLRNQQARLQTSASVIEFIENKVLTPDQSILLAIHGYKKKDISKFLMKKHYKNDLLQACDKNYADYEQLHQTIINEYSVLDDDIQFVYHKANYLMRLFRMIDNLASENPGLGINYRRAADSIDSCISCLDSYYLQDKNIRKVAHYYSRGYTEPQICDAIGKSRTYVRNAISESSKAIVSIIWGYFNV